MKSTTKNKTPPISWGRNEKSCEPRRRIVAVPVVLEPVVAPVPHVAVEVEVTDVELLAGVAVMYSAPSMTPSFEYSQD